MAPNLTPLNFNNIQGDILLGLPKKGEIFFFFNINDGTIRDFCTQLGELTPLITTVAQVQDDRIKIQNEKDKAKTEHRNPQILDMTAVNIAFSQKGLLQLGINDNIGDEAFKAGQFADAQNLADNPDNWDPEFKTGVHGVILITGSNHRLIDAKLETVKGIFGVGGPNASITEVKKLEGHTRPGDESGHEHFGYEDGVSQPAVQGVPIAAQRGVETVHQGIILCGREGDDGVVSPPGTPPQGVDRPDWALDGSFFVFRHLTQRVPEFDAFLEQNALTVPDVPGNPSGADLLGARLVGRWKSGAPVDLSDKRDDEALTTNSKIDAFRFNPADQITCPFAAHIRKTNPRSDLDALGGTEIRRIIRRGIQFGPEVSPAEAAGKRSDPARERGLYFACYQSNIVNGFRFVQQSWANAPNFPLKKNASPPVSEPGFDAIIGQGSSRSIVGFDPNNPEKSLPLPEEWVVSKGGEYFFSPSISALQETFAQAA